MKNSETKSRLEDKITDYSHDSLRKRAKYVCNIHNIDKGLVKEIGAGCYPSIFKAVKELPQNERRLLVSDFYSGFPNGKDLGKYMNRILEINWFKPERNYTKKEITPYIREIESAFKLEEHPILITNSWNVARDVDWGVALNAALYANENAAWDATLGFAGNFARNAAGDVAGYAALNAALYANENAALDVAGYAAACARYIIAQDIPSLKEEYPINPFEKLIRVYEKGLWPAGISSEGRFIVLHPKVNKK